MTASRHSDSGGLGPKLPAACLAFLQEALEGRVDTAHLTSCGSCATRHAGRQQLQAALRARPLPPIQLSSRAMVEATLERIVEGAEASNPLAAWLGERASVPAPDLAWPEPLMGSHVGQMLETAPPSPPATVWASVERDLIASLGSQRTARPHHHLWLGAIAVAAAAVVTAWLLPLGTKPTTTIVFLDLDKPPTSDFPWLSGGH